MEKVLKEVREVSDIQPLSRTVMLDDTKSITCHMELGIKPRLPLTTTTTSHVFVTRMSKYSCTTRRPSLLRHYNNFITYFSNEFSIILI
jgi:hypothetical protein